MRYFNPRSREGSDAVPKVKHIPASGFQSTLPRGERRYSATHSDTVYVISIHAPARGATLSDRETVTESQHFNPRSREGSDWLLPARANCRTDFNPRSREGSDGNIFDNPELLEISIHAPARGATENFFTNFCILFLISIHAPARGATLYIALPHGFP